MLQVFLRIFEPQPAVKITLYITRHYTYIHITRGTHSYRPLSNSLTKRYLPLLMWCRLIFLTQVLPYFLKCWPLPVKLMSQPDFDWVWQTLLCSILLVRIFHFYSQPSSFPQLWGENTGCCCMLLPFPSREDIQGKRLGWRKIKPARKHSLQRTDHILSSVWLTEMTEGCPKSQQRKQCKTVCAK